MQVLAGCVITRRGRPGLLLLILLSTPRDRPRAPLPLRPKLPDKAQTSNTPYMQPLWPIRVPHHLHHLFANPEHTQERSLPTQLPRHRLSCSTPAETAVVKSVRGQAVLEGNMPC